MTQEEKELLGVDISARITYGLLFNLNGKIYPLYKVYNDGSFLLGDEHSQRVGDNAKPYLRPMSSMTEEEKETYKRFCNEDIRQLTYVQEVHPSLKQKTSCYRSIDWLNAHHFDYRGLIPMGLALKAPEDMYNN